MPSLPRSPPLVATGVAILLSAVLLAVYQPLTAWVPGRFGDEAPPIPVKISGKSVHKGLAYWLGVIGVQVGLQQ